MKISINIDMNYYEPISVSPKPLTLEGHANLYHTKKSKSNGQASFRLPLIIEKHIDPAVSKFFNRRGLYIRAAELFYSAPYRESMIHSDGNPNDYEIINDMAKINFISGGEDSFMNWYQPKIEKPYTPTGKDNNFISFSPNEVMCVASDTITGYNIVQTGIPHNITTKSKSRYCVSLTLAIRNQAPKMIPYDTMISLLTSTPQ
jgi:hypothetical protein